MKKTKILLDFFPEFVQELHAQLRSDQERWGDTWKTRPAYKQEERVFARYTDYFDQFRNAGTPVPWLKVAGEAFICWVRETFPNYKDL